MKRVARLVVLEMNRAASMTAQRVKRKFLLVPNRNTAVQGGWDVFEVAVASHRLPELTTPLKRANHCRIFPLTPPGPIWKVGWVIPESESHFSRIRAASGNRGRAKSHFPSVMLDSINRAISNTPIQA
jgi:hypothetical protein